MCRNRRTKAPSLAGDCAYCQARAPADATDSPIRGCLGREAAIIVMDHYFVDEANPTDQELEVWAYRGLRALRGLRHPCLAATALYPRAITSSGAARRASDFGPTRAPGIVRLEFAWAADEGEHVDRAEPPPDKARRRPR